MEKGREECAEEHAGGKKEREGGMVLKVEEQPVTQPEGGEKGGPRIRRGDLEEGKE